MSSEFFQDYVNTELPSRLSSKDKATDVTEGLIPVSTGNGLSTEFKEPSEILNSSKKGLSAYQVALASGFVGTSLEWLESLVGPKGEPGSDGKDGNPGLPGEPGEKGPKGDAALPFIVVGQLNSPSELPLPEDSLPAEAYSVVYNEVVHLYVFVPATNTWTRLGPLQGPKGDIGPKGDRGVQGVKGDPGPKGDKGDTGTRGFPGEPGKKGDKGDRGPRGEWGLKGDTGTRGFPGEPGKKGDKGDIGPIGPMGPKGDRGTQGEVGPIGPKGVQGDIGPIGPIGPKGVKGDIGPKGDSGGPSGPQGEVGPIGPKGDRGVQGVKGDPGPKGDKGDTGATGPRGLTGATGAPGSGGVNLSQDNAWTGRQSYRKSGMTFVSIGSNPSTINFNNGNFQKATFTSSRTLHIGTPPEPGVYYVSLQLNSNNIRLTFSNSALKWQFGIMPETTNMAGVDLLCIFYDGTNMLASLSPGYR